MENIANFNNRNCIGNLKHRINSHVSLLRRFCLGMKVALLFLSLFGLTFSSFGQSVGDYGSAGIGPANWATAGSWVVCVTAGTWTGATVATTAPTATKNVWIRAGNTITMNGNQGNCLNLTVNGTANWTLARRTNVAGNFVISGGTLSGSATGTLNVTGSFTVPASATASVQRVTLTITGTTSISGALTFATSATGTKSFYGAVTINNGGSWVETVAPAMAFRGGITNNGTFTANTGVHTFSTNNQVLTGTFSIPSVTITGVTLTNSNLLAVGTALTGTGGLTQVASATLNIGGTSTITTLTATNTGNLVNYNGAANQTVKATTYYNLTTSGSGTKTTGGIVNIGGNLIVSAGSTFATGATNTWTLSVTGTTSVSGTLTLANTAAKTFTGDVTINSGGVWNETGAAAINMAGNLQFSGTTFTASTGIHTFSGTAKTISGTLSIPSVTVTGTYTNNNTLSVGTALAGTGGLTQATNATLNIGGTSAITTLTATNTGNLVNYTGAAQTVNATTYYNLTLSGSAAKTLPAGTTTVNNILSREGTCTVTLTGTLSYGSAATLQYKGSAAQTTGPEFPATFGGSGGVIINNASGVTLGSSVAVTNGLTLTSGTFAVAGYTLTLNGSTIAGTPTNLSTTAASSLVFGGSSSGVQLPSSVTLLNNLTLNNTNGLTINNNLDISTGASGILTLTSGKLNAQGFTVKTKTISGCSATNYVIGKLSLNIPTGAANVTFCIGDASNYTPVNMAFGNVTTTGYITVSTTNGQHPNVSTSGINYSKDVARYYTLTNPTTGFATNPTAVFNNCAITFTFVAGDIIGSGNTANFVVKNYTGAAWASPTVGIKTATTTQITGYTTSAFGDFAIGEPQSLGSFAFSLTSPQTSAITFTGTNTLTALDVSGNVYTLFNPSTDNVSIVANAPLTTGAAAISGLQGSGNVLNLAADFVSGVANLTSLGLKYTGVAGTGTYTATSASTNKTGTSGNVTINLGNLTISAIGTQTAGTGFSVTVTSSITITTASLITLTLATGTGTLSGTLTGTIASGSNNVTINGVIYNKAESGVSITATQSSGAPAVSTGTSNSFTVNPGTATKLIISTIASPQTAGAGFNVTVTSQDANGNLANVTSATGISLSRATGTGTLSGTTTGTIAINTNSVTISGVKYSVAENGVSLTAARTSGMPLASGTSNTFLVVPDPTKSTLNPTASSITANGTSTQILTVQAKDAAGNNLSTGGSTVTITQSSGTGTIGSVTDNGNGTYTATVTSPITVGSGTFVATMNTNPVQSGSGSQTVATVNYIPGAASAAQSTLTPTTASIPDDGVTIQVLTVQAIDANGNNLTTGGATVTITLSSGVGNISAVTDNGNGTYTANVTSAISGFGVFIATLGGNPVMSGSGSQSQSTITFNTGIENPANSTLLPLVSNIIDDGVSTQVLTVQAKDATGNNLSTGGAAVIISQKSGTGNLDNNGGASYDNNNGTYTATVTSPGGTPPQSGVFVATLNGSTVNNGTGSQTQVTVNYGSDANHSTLTPLTQTVSGSGLDTAYLTVQAEDANGNNITSGGETVVVTKLSGTGTILAVQDNGNGTYTIPVVSGTALGNGVFVATLNGNPVKSGTGSQTQATVIYAGTANAAQSTLTPTSGSITADGISTIELTVQANDVNGNNLSTGGSTVTITKLSGTGTIGSVLDNLDGTYSAIVTSPTATGSGVFVATLGGSQVKSGGGSQTQSTITYIPGAANATQSTLTPTSASIASCGSTQVLTVQTKDVNGNNLTLGGATVTITIQTGSGSISAVTDNGNGTYTATLTSPSPTTSGSAVLVATLGGLPVMSGTASQTQATITYTQGFTVGISGGTSPICANNSPGTFTATGSGGPGPITYLWYANGTSTGVTTNTYNPGALASSSNFYCAVSSGTCGTINTSTTAITVNPNPTVNVGGAMAAICQGGTSAALGGSFGGGATSAVWSDGGAGGSFANNGGATPNTSTYTASAASGTPVTLTLTTAGGSCGTTNANKSIVVNPSPNTGPFYHKPNQ